MLVVLSDLHLSDETITGKNDNVSERAFALLADTIDSIVCRKNVKITKVDFLFLGDTFDILRSKAWQQCEFKPWSLDPRIRSDLADEKAARRAIDKTVTQIMKRTMKLVGPAFAHLVKLKDKTARRDRLLDLSFRFVLGNHDRLLLASEAARAGVTQAVGSLVPDAPFIPSYVSPSSGYDVVARHGHRFDSWNDCDGDRSCIGDAICVALLNEFISRAATVMEDPRRGEGLEEQLRHLQDVRPDADVFMWLAALFEQLPAKTSKALKAIYKKVVDEFFEIPFVQVLDEWNFLELDVVDQLEKVIYAPLSGVGFQTKQLDRFLHWYTESRERYFQAAMMEPSINDGKARFVVYGHTHVPMVKAFMGPDQKKTCTYVNSGTWRTLVEKMRQDYSTLPEFSMQQEMSYLFFYAPRERDDDEVRLETWTGSRR